MGKLQFSDKLTKEPQNIFFAMIYFLLAFAFLIYIIFSISRKNQEKILAEIRLNWGRRVNKKGDLELIEKYAIHNKAKHFHRLTLQTLKDIDIENLFSILDRTLTTVGQQLLYNKIIFPENSLKRLKQFDESSEYFKKETNKRETVQVILHKLEKKRYIRNCRSIKYPKFRY